MMPITYEAYPLDACQAIDCGWSLPRESEDG
jgi:hypothetical protein